MFSSFPSSPSPFADSPVPRYINPLYLLADCQAFGGIDVGSSKQLNDLHELQATSEANGADAAHPPDPDDVPQPHAPGLGNGESGWGVAAVSPEPLGASSQPLTDSPPHSKPDDVFGGLPRNRTLAPTGGAVIVRTTPPKEIKRRGRKKLPGLESGRKRVKTLQVRKCGACFRCSTYKEECDAGEGDCRRCRKVFASPTSQWSTACFRLGLKDCSVIRESSPLWGKKSPTPDEVQWLSLSGEKAICFYHLWPAEGLRTAGPRFEINVREFRPQMDDLTGRKYQTTGGFAQIDRPHYATMEDMQALSARLKLWIEEKRGYLLDVYGFGSEAGGETSWLMNKAIVFARENKSNAEQGSMVDLALNVLVGSRLNSSERSVSGLDEAEPINDENSILNNVNPIPTRLDYQLDMAVADLQKAELGVIFKRLYRKAKAPTNDPDAAGSWWEIFLAVFLLMQTAQFVHKTQKQFPSYILASFYTRAREIQEKSATMIEKWEISAPNVADVFLYYCRRHFGGSPFRPRVISTASEKAGLQTNELNFLRDRVAWANRSGFPALPPHI
ncbi:MAG: hypothetical protein M1840_007048 [Geoglossum simile]|nr:MAG: hypothetical protein M1840_007048 [Geoglossum simile]